MSPEQMIAATLVALALTDAGMTAPVDPDLLAIELGLEVYTAPGARGMLLGRRIIVDDDAPDRDAAVALGLGLYMCREAGRRNDWEAAETIARILLGTAT